MIKKTTGDKELKNTRVAEMIKLNERFLEDFTPREQLVMLRLLLMANDEGVAEITTRALADMCEMTRQNVRSVLTSLHEKGCVLLDVKQKTNPKSNPKGNPKSTFVTICNYDSYKVGRKKTTQNTTQKATQNAIYVLQAKCKEREKVFEQSLVPFVISRGGIYQPAMIRAFFNYWTEKNKSGTKMRFEHEKTWETSKRLVTWANNEKEYGKRNNNNRTPATDKAASRNALENLADVILGKH